MGTERGSSSIDFVVGLIGCGLSIIEAPFGDEGLGLLPRGGELKVASLSWDDGALVSGSKAGSELGHKATSLLRVQITDLLWNIQERGHLLVVALLGSLLSHTSGTANLNWKLFTLGVTNKLSRAHLNVLGCAG